MLPLYTHTYTCAIRISNATVTYSNSAGITAEGREIKGI